MSYKKRHLVSGGAGFLGSHIIKKLLEDENEIICLDNFSSGKNYLFAKFESEPKVKLINHDITIPIDFEIDRIWHLACPASPEIYIKKPIETSRINFLGTYNMLELASKYNSKLLLASSSEVYGDAKEHPQKESYTGSVKTTGLRSCYEEGKRMAETLCADFQRVHGVDIRIARIFNTYGPNMRIKDGRVISNFIVQSLTNKKLSIYGDGNQTRSFCYIDDLIAGMILLMESNFQSPINLGNPKELSINELVLLIKKQIDPNLKLTFRSLPKDDPKKRNPSVILAKKILNWDPNIELEDGLLRTIEWFKENI